MTKNIKSEIFKQIQIGKQSNLISICTDIWSDKFRHNSYLDVTAVLVNKDFKLNHFAIGFAHFDSSHTGDNIRHKINGILGKFELHSIDLPFVTDSARNMQKAFKHTTWFP